MARPRGKRVGKYLYAVASPIGYVKFGVADWPEARIASIQSSHPTPLTLLGYVEHASCELSEREFHKRLQDHRTSGEWFAICDDVIDASRAVFGEWVAEQLEAIHNSVRESHDAHLCIEVTMLRRENAKLRSRVDRLEATVRCAVEAKERAIAQNDEVQCDAVQHAFWRLSEAIVQAHRLTVLHKAHREGRDIVYSDL